MKNDNKNSLSEIGFMRLNDALMNTIETANENGLFGGLSAFRRKRPALNEDEILEFWKKNVRRTKFMSVLALTLPVFWLGLVQLGFFEMESSLWAFLFALPAYALTQLWLLQGLEGLLGTWKALSIRRARKAGEERWEYVLPEKRTET